MGKVNNENYFQISGWMLNELQLKGNELLVYAIIYGFTQSTNCYTGSLEYLVNFTGATKPTIISILKKLIKRGLLIKEKVVTNKGVCCIYKTVKNFNLVKKLNSGGKETLPRAVKKLNSDGKETLPNNNTSNDDGNDSDNNIGTSKKFQKPTLEEVKEYIHKNNYSVDAERFIDYYESNGWKVGKNPMKDWKACVRTWNKNTFGYTKKQNAMQIQDHPEDLGEILF